ncbi:MAG: HAMP domain-containing protein [Bdellovibrionales bacterium]|nr:HAMP domain-containing protein [Bdellovibrionales bacterium]
MVFALAVTGLLVGGLSAGWYINSLFAKISDTQAASHFDRLRSKTQTYGNGIKSAFFLYLSSFDYSMLQTLLSDTVRADGEIQSITIFRQDDGLVIASNDGSQLLHKLEDRRLSSEFQRVRVAGEREVFRTDYVLDYESTPYVLRIEYRVESYDKALAVLTAERQRQSQEFALAGAALLFLLVVASFGVARWIGQLVSLPLKNLNQSAQEIAAGDLSRPVTALTKDEIGELAESLELMRKNILVKIVEIENANATLETKVEERTKELKKAQVALVQSGKMAALGIMSAGIAHEINNPLAIVTMYLETLSRSLRKLGLADDQIKKFEESSARVFKAVERISQIINHVKVFARQSQDNQRVDVKVADLLSDVKFFSEPIARNHQVQIDYQGTGDHLMVRCVKGDLVSVLQNLVQNAIDAFEGRREPDAGRRVTVKVGSSHKMVRIEVEDNAGGIPLEIQQRIFDPFFTTKDIGKGTGLGLSLCYSIIQNYGGKIDFDTEVGRGTRFLVQIPLLAQASVDATAEPQKLVS